MFKKNDAFYTRIENFTLTKNKLIDEVSRLFLINNTTLCIKIK